MFDKLRTPLHEAVQLADENMLKLLWKLKADANVLDKDEKSPLHVSLTSLVTTF